MTSMTASRVFLSHTSDLACSPRDRTYVQAALDAIARAGMVAVDMRYFAAQDSSPAECCRTMVRGCEIYVAVVGFSYGSRVPGEEISYTQLEFEEASSAGLPRLVFFLEKADLLWPDPSNSDGDEANGLRQLLHDADIVIRTFNSADGLELEVFHALREMADDSQLKGRPTAKSFAQLLWALGVETGQLLDELARPMRLWLRGG